MGNRIAKHVTKSGHTVSTYYFLDAQGNQMAMYQHKNEEENGISNNNLYLSERNLYGSSRMGQEQIGEIIASKIGRASCRERVKNTGGAEKLTKQTKKYN